MQNQHKINEYFLPMNKRLRKENRQSSNLMQTIKSSQILMNNYNSTDLEQNVQNSYK